ncbi:helix-turn-helix domain-containing protein [Actinosynnema sp. ALI-1.44]|uniref:helix-turn-helix domain-containing protein n=1 Tax=Actinosynnema sp. ALI-1.44 TaxID=1933779 RepID=UPI00143D3873|nr:helix-turn-helix transcriptional regulator [Actinosynnema sp. ALI-1.44]
MKLNTYQCPERTGVWHYGGPPPGGRAEAERMQRRAHSTRAVTRMAREYDAALRIAIPARSGLYAPAGHAQGVLRALLAHGMPLYMAELARVSDIGADAVCYWLRRFIRNGFVERVPTVGLGPDGYVRYGLTQAGRRFAAISSVADILRYYARPQEKREKTARDQLVGELRTTRQILAAVAVDLFTDELHPIEAVASAHRAMASIDQIYAQIEYVVRADTGQILRHIRCFREMSTSQVAAKLGVSNRTMIKVESGDAMPSWQFLRNVTNLYDVPLSAFLVPACAPNASKNQNVAPTEKEDL